VHTTESTFAKGESDMAERKGSWVLIAILLVAAAVLIGAAYNGPHASDKAPAVGAAAPDFTLMSQEGKPVNLRDFRGKWVVLYFYPKDFSSGCTVEAHNFQRDFAQYEQKNAAIVGVSVDSFESHQKFCTKEGLNFKLLADSDHKVSDEYGSIMNLGVKKLSSRHTFLINPDGVIVKEYLDVNPGKHSEEVLADLTQLQSQGSK
jgi:peroxiredoxin Q/BCP